jgi:hypothetical protein
MNMLEGMPQRQAALLLHALSASDQAWLLATLSEQDSRELTALLQELRAMNVTPDPAWLAQWLPQTESTEENLLEAQSPDANAFSLMSPASKSHAELIELKPHQVSDLARLLSAEPVQLTLRLLRIQPWPWREKLISQMSASAQMRLRQSLRDLTGDADLGEDAAENAHMVGPNASGLNQALVDVLARRMAQTATTDPGKANDSAVFLSTRLVALWRRVGPTGLNGLTKGRVPS